MKKIENIFLLNAETDVHYVHIWWQLCRKTNK